MTEDEFIAARVAALNNLIVAIEAALLTVTTGGTSYSLDDGQTRTMVTRSSTQQLMTALGDALSQRAALLAQLGRGVLNVRPGF